MPVGNRNTATGSALVAIALVLGSHAVWAEPPAPISAPPPPPVLQSGQPLEPEVRILRSDREVIYEYRRNGQLYLVRVQPAYGPPYHFVDVNGDGELDYRPGEPVRDNVNQWILFRW
jgi:hypothetical protein